MVEGRERRRRVVTLPLKTKVKQAERN